VGDISRGVNSSPFQAGVIRERATPRIATSEALIIGVNAVPPMPPRLEIVNVPPCRSVTASLPSRAVADTVPSSWLSSVIPLRSMSRITRTTRPSGVSTATPMWW